MVRGTTDVQGTPVLNTDRTMVRYGSCIWYHCRGVCKYFTYSHETLDISWNTISSVRPTVPPYLSYFWEVHGKGKPSETEIFGKWVFRRPHCLYKRLGDYSQGLQTLVHPNMEWDILYKGSGGGGLRSTLSFRIKGYCSGESPTGPHSSLVRPLQGRSKSLLVVPSRYRVWRTPWFSFKVF